MMFIDPMLILTAGNLLESSFEHRNPTLFAIGAGMLGVGTLGWAGTKAFVKKDSKASKPMNRTFKTTGGASILVILASLLGLGWGSGSGVGPGEATEVPADSTQESVQESTQETYAEDFVLRVSKTEVYVNGVLCKDAEAVKAVLLADFKDGNSLLLIDDYADNETYGMVKDVLKELAITYSEKQKN